MASYLKIQAFNLEMEGLRSLRAGLAGTPTTGFTTLMENQFGVRESAPFDEVTLVTFLFNFPFHIFSIPFHEKSKTLHVPTSYSPNKSLILRLMKISQRVTLQEAEAPPSADTTPTTSQPKLK